MQSSLMPNAPEAGRGPRRKRIKHFAVYWRDPGCKYFAEWSKFGSYSSIETAESVAAGIPRKWPGWEVEVRRITNPPPAP